VTERRDTLKRKVSHRYIALRKINICIFNQWTEATDPKKMETRSGSKTATPKYTEAELEILSDRVKKRENKAAAAAQALQEERA